MRTRYIVAICNGCKKEKLIIHKSRVLCALCLSKVNTQKKFDKKNQSKQIKIGGLFQRGFNKLKKKKSLIDECDILWGEIIRKRAGYKCEKCDGTNVIQAHHIIPRTCWALRFDLINGISLCKQHHLYWAHKDALAFEEWVRTKRDLDYLKLNRHRKTNKDYQLLKIYLEKELAKS